ncbi:hypothetical protein FSP39_010019 [Pinctada imbricata]|uniref:Transposase Helix-turn-helix domain-containing protein n=1 Tax=Pinctada imbricata TaxID=66713 RepID=A0AA89CD96_PINIB|nr:hypothetical protein FSP39_010019 [Pinctada imbricata]
MESSDSDRKSGREERKREEEENRRRRAREREEKRKLEETFRKGRSSAERLIYEIDEILDWKIVDEVKCKPFVEGRRRVQEERERAIERARRIRRSVKKLEAWEDYTARLLSILEMWGKLKFKKVCSDHFPDGNGRTWEHQIPTIFLPQKSEKKIKKRSSRNSTGKKRDVPSTQTAPASTENAVFLNFHNYSKEKDSEHFSDEQTGQDNGVVQHEQGSSACANGSPTVKDAYTEVERPEITVEDIRRSDDKVLFYTGLPDWATFGAFFECLVQYWGDKLVLDNESPIGTPNKKGAKRKLRLQDELLLVMMRLRLGLLLKDLEYRFKASAGPISRIFTVWIRHMCRVYGHFVP